MNNLYVLSTCKIILYIDQLTPFGEDKCLPNWTHDSLTIVTFVHERVHLFTGNVHERT